MIGIFFDLGFELGGIACQREACQEQPGAETPGDIDDDFAQRNFRLRFAGCFRTGTRAGRVAADFAAFDFLNADGFLNSWQEHVHRKGVGQSWHHRQADDERQPGFYSALNRRCFRTGTGFALCFILVFNGSGHSQGSV